MKLKVFYPQLTAMDRVRSSCPKSIGTLRVLDDVRVLTLLINHTESMTKASSLLLKNIKVQEKIIHRLSA